jgi:hypothetical protein
MDEKSRLKALGGLSAFTLMLVGAGVSTGAQAQSAVQDTSHSASAPISKSDLSATSSGKTQVVVSGNHDHNWLGGDHDHPQVVRVAGSNPGHFDV